MSGSKLKRLVPAISEHLADYERKAVESRAYEKKQAERTIADIPRKIAKSIHAGLDHAVVLDMRQGVHFEYAHWWDGITERKPRQECLRFMAKVVYDFCVKFGLQPHFSKIQIMRTSISSSMIVRWDPEHVAKLLAELRKK